MGGEEFSVFLPGISPEGAKAVAERIRTVVKGVAFCPEGVPCSLSISVGAITFVRETSFSELYRLADQRLYAAKHSGRDRVELGHLTSRDSPAAVH